MNCTVGYGGKERGAESGLADQWFESQKKFYVDIGKAFGDEVCTLHAVRLYESVHLHVLYSNFINVVPGISCIAYRV